MSKLTPPATESTFWHSLTEGAQKFLREQGALGGFTPTPPAPTPAPLAPPPEPDPTRHERRAQAQQQAPRRRTRITLEDRDTKRLAKLRAKTRKITGDATHPGPRLCPSTVDAMCQDIMADATGAAVRIYMRAEPNKVALGSMREAALVPSEEGCRYVWADERARSIAALGLAMLRLGVPARENGKWRSIIRGMPVGVYRGLLRNPFTGEKPSRSALAGRHRPGGCVANGQVGYLVALREAGFTYSYQLHANDPKTQRWEMLGTSGRPTARRWLLGFLPTAPRDDDEKRRLMAWHYAGWEAMEERPQRVPPVLRRANAPPLSGPPPPLAA